MTFRKGQFGEPRHSTQRKSELVQRPRPGEEWHIVGTQSRRLCSSDPASRCAEGDESRIKLRGEIMASSANRLI